jgi:hypothetical protein
MVSLRRAVIDATRFGIRFARSSEFRRAVQRAAARTGDAAAATAQQQREEALVPASARAHRRLNQGSLALAVITPTRSEPHLNVVLSEFNPDGMFAGVSTALDITAKLADELGVPIRLVVLTERFHEEHAERARTVLADRWGRPVVVVTREQISQTPFGTDDHWLVTHWTTAHAAQVAAQAGVIARHRTIYLIQDFEPGFSGWSTTYSVARATYDAGFHHLVNSRPLADYLETAGIAADLVFAPEIPVERFAQLAPSRRGERIRVLFYGRPSRPRNLFALGLAALEFAVERLGPLAHEVDFESAGEAHGPFELGDGVTLHSLGKLSWDDYFDRIATTDVVLSLQASPHPSHPPLEAAVSGAVSVTNEFDGTRTGLHPRLVSAAATPEGLGEAVVRAILAARDSDREGYLPIADGILGRPADEVIPEIARRLAQAPPGSSPSTDAR